MTRQSLVPLQLPADPVNPLEAATKQYVDGFASGPWPACTPTLSNGWVRNNGTLVGFVQQVGQTVRFRIEYVVGSSDTKGAAITFDIPVAARALTTGIAFANQVPINGACGLFDLSSGNHDFSFTPVFLTATTLRPVNSTATTGVNSTTPWTWATGDWMVVTGTYEAA